MRHCGRNGPCANGYPGQTLPARSIRTSSNLGPFVPTRPPQLNFVGSGMARFFARVRVEHFRKETDGAFTRLDPTFHLAASRYLRYALSYRDL